VNETDCGDASACLNRNPVTGATPPVLIQNTYRKNQAEKTLFGPKTSDSHDVPVPCGGHSSPDLVADLAKRARRTT